MVIFFLFLLVGVSSWETIEIDSVYQELPYTELSDISINRKVKEGSWLIFFTDTVCSNCQAIENIWWDLASELKKSGVQCGKINTAGNIVTKKRFEIQKTPEIVLLNHGSMYLYRGDYEKSSIKQFALNGFKNMPKKPIPSRPSIILTLLQDIFQTIWDVLGVYSILILGGVFSLLLLFLLSTCVDSLKEKLEKSE